MGLVVYLCKTVNPCATQADHSVIQNRDTVTLRASSCLLVLRAVQPLRLWQASGYQNGPQTTWKDMETENTQCITTSSETPPEDVQYSVRMRYIQGKTTLLRMPYPESPAWNPLISVKEYRYSKLMQLPTHCPLAASPAKLDEIRNWTSQDIVPSHLKDVIHQDQGWPEYPNECPANLKELWNLRDDLSVENGPILKGHHLLILSNLRTQILQIIHQGYLGVEKCNLKAKDSLLAWYPKRYEWNDSQLPHLHAVL